MKKLLTVLLALCLCCAPALAAELTTDGGSLWVHGEGLRLKDLEGGRLVLTGQVSALIYEQTRPRGGILRRILRR